MRSEPLAAGGARIAVARERGDQRAEMQRSGGRGSEAAAVGRPGRRRAAAFTAPRWATAASPCFGAAAGVYSQLRFIVAEHGVRILGPAEAAVVAAERAVEIAVLDVEVVAQDHAAVAQVRAQMEQIVLGRADELGPERHHLHVAARVGGRDRVLAEIAFVLDHAEHELRIESRARRLVVDGGDEIVARAGVGHPSARAAATSRRATARTLGLVRVVGGHRVVGDRALQAGDDRRRELLLDLGAGERGQRRERDERRGRERRADQPAHAVPQSRHCFASFPLMNAAISATATGVAAASRRAWYSTLPSLRPAIADRDPVRNADQLEISKHHARTLAAVVEQHFDPGRFELVVQAVGQRPDGVAAVVADRRDRHGERRQRLGPDDALGVVVLLDRGGDDAGDADAVAAHLHDLRLTAGVEKGCTHRLRIDVAQREHVADLDAAQDLERPLAVGRRVAGDDVAEVGDEVGLAAVAAEIDAAQVEVALVRAADEIRHHRHRAVDDQRQVLRDADRAEVAGIATGRRDDLGLGGPAEFLEARRSS